MRDKTGLCVCVYVARANAGNYVGAYWALLLHCANANVMRGICVRNFVLERMLMMMLAFRGELISLYVLSLRAQKVFQAIDGKFVSKGLNGLS